MKKILTVIAASMFALAMSPGIYAAHHNKANQSHPLTTNGMSHLFVISAKTAQLKKGANGTIILVIKKSDLDRIIEFSEHPFHMIIYRTGSDLVNLWGKGADGFAVDPPNAVLSGANLESAIAIISGIRITDNALFFKIKEVPLNRDGWPLNIRSIVMIIDSSTIATGSYREKKPVKPWSLRSEDNGGSASGVYALIELLSESKENKPLVDD